MTGFRRRLLIFGLPLLEAVTAYLIGRAIGWGWMLLLLVAGVPVGFAIMRNAADGAMREAQAAAVARRPIDAGRHALVFAGGVLIAIPGFWSDLLGLLLVIPFTQRLFRTRARGWVERRFTVVRVPGMRFPGGDVIQGTVVPPGDDPPSAPPAREIS